MSSPCAACAILVGVGLVWRSSRLGLLKSGTVRSRQPPTASTATSSGIQRILFIARILIGHGMSEAYLYFEPEGAAGREGGDINIPCDVLVSEVAHFGIESGVIGEREQVAPGDAEPRILRRAPQAGDQAAWQLV